MSIGVKQIGQVIPKTLSIAANAIPVIMVPDNAYPIFPSSIEFDQIDKPVPRVSDEHARIFEAHWIYIEIVMNIRLQSKEPAPRRGLSYLSTFGNRSSTKVQKAVIIRILCLGQTALGDMPLKHVPDQGTWYVNLAAAYERRRPMQFSLEMLIPWFSPSQ